MAAQRGKPSGLHQGSSEANTMLKEEPTGFAKALDANVPRSGEGDSNNNNKTYNNLSFELLGSPNTEGVPKPKVWLSEAEQAKATGNDEEAAATLCASKITADCSVLLCTFS
uniref:Uncharacterized protein n=1 Tax=Mustela putorius furo TaxID=9669 RepID=M3YSF3_MUSPF